MIWFFILILPIMIVLSVTNGGKGGAGNKNEGNKRQVFLLGMW